MNQGDALNTKNCIFAHQKINFSHGNFLVRECKKNLLKIGKLS